MCKEESASRPPACPTGLLPPESTEAPLLGSPVCTQSLDNVAPVYLQVWQELHTTDGASPAASANQAQAGGRWGALSSGGGCYCWCCCCCCPHCLSSRHTRCQLRVGRPTRHCWPFTSPAQVCWRGGRAPRAAASCDAGAAARLLQVSSPVQPACPPPHACLLGAQTVYKVIMDKGRSAKLPYAERSGMVRPLDLAGSVPLSAQVPAGQRRAAPAGAPAWPVHGSNAAAGAAAQPCPAGGRERHAGGQAQCSGGGCAACRAGAAAAAGTAGTAAAAASVTAATGGGAGAEAAGAAAGGGQEAAGRGGGGRRGQQAACQAGPSQRWGDRLCPHCRSGSAFGGSQAGRGRAQAAGLGPCWRASHPEG